MALMDLLPHRKETVVETPPAPAPVSHKGRLIIGFNVYEWDTADPTSVARVKAQFYHCLTVGMAAFETVTEQSWSGPRQVEQSTRDFRPEEVEQYRMTAAYAGG